MLGLSEISPLLAPAGAALNARSPKEAAVEFDALIVEVLLRNSGWLQAAAGGESAESSMYGEVYLHDFARQLARQVDLGFGRLLAQYVQQPQEVGR
jgi:Rod binding domain-containing protein